MSSPALIPHLVVLGGFLGAGKTTAMRCLATRALDMGIRVGVITNDQGIDLVDTQLMRSCGFATREVTGGCFCCRFDALLDAAASLASDVGPELYLAESVGSCTDLVATVTTPMRRLFADRFTLAPLSVLVDPLRATAILGLGNAAPHDDDVAYVYRKQLEEAELIVMTKCDVLSDDRINEAGNALAVAFPHAEVLAVSARDGMQMDDWMQRLLFGTSSDRASPDIDYDRYAAGEARFGWLDASLTLVAKAPVDADALLQEFALALQARLRGGGAIIAHLKLTFAPDGAAPDRIAAAQLARDDALPEATRTLGEPASAGTLLLNLRAEAPSSLLDRLVRETIEGPPRTDPMQLTIDRLDAFAPGRPQPTHRIATG